MIRPALKTKLHIALILLCLGLIFALIITSNNGLESEEYAISFYLQIAFVGALILGSIFFLVFSIRGILKDANANLVFSDPLDS